jgi:hypothetical protein
MSKPTNGNLIDRLREKLQVPARGRLMLEQLQDSLHFPSVVRWSRLKPTLGGWYWWRPRKNSARANWRIGHAEFFPFHDFMDGTTENCAHFLVQGDGERWEDVEVLEIAKMRGQFAGPIPEPAEGD